MELYRDGCIDLPEEIIKIWADNGYGKMVSRRQGNENPRVYALPAPGEKGKAGGHHGLYYHVSFYDLQVANYITMQPNSMKFIRDELQYAFSQGADDFLIVNCSNIKPHVYFLDGISKMWTDGTMEVREQGMNYIRNYFFQAASYFFQWKRELLYSDNDRKVMLLTNLENHLTNEEIYECMKREEES